MGCCLRFYIESVQVFTRQNFEELSKMAGGVQSPKWKRCQVEVSIALAQLKVPLSISLSDIQGSMQGAMDEIIQNMTDGGVLVAADRQTQMNSLVDDSPVAMKAMSLLQVSGPVAACATLGSLDESGLNAQEVIHKGDLDIQGCEGTKRIQRCNLLTSSELDDDSVISEA